MNRLRFRIDLQTDVISYHGLCIESFHKGEILVGNIHNRHSGLVDIEAKDGRALLDVPENDIEIIPKHQITVQAR